MNGLTDRPLPEKTLAWQIMDWCSAYLLHPDGAKRGEMWEFTNEQARFLAHFYAVDDRGRFLYRRAILERAKGWGKSPLVAAICCAELLGPVRFDGWDAYGEPVGAPAHTPLVQIAAISDSQADNTMSLAGAMLANGPAEEEYSLDIALSRILVPGELRRLEKVTASPRGREGNRATFIVMDETGLWVPAEHGPQLAEALRRNLAKMGGRSIETTNAPKPGENSVAEGSHRYWEKIQSGQAYDNSLLFDSISRHVEDIYDDPEKIKPILKEVYGDAHWAGKGADSDGEPWSGLDRIIAEINDPDNSESSSRRFYFNEMTIGESGWLKPKAIEAARRPGLRYLRRTDKISLGFKGDQKHCAALVACRLSDQSLWVIRAWEKPDNADRSWEVPFREVDAVVRKTMDSYAVWNGLADPWQYQDIVGRWAADYEDSWEEFWLTSKAKYAKAIEGFESAVNTGRTGWHPNQRHLEQHLLACHIQETPQGDLIRKETADSKRYITIAQAAILALEAAQVAIEDGAMNENVDRQIYAW
jgi:hypothetical protein